MIHEIIIEVPYCDTFETNFNHAFLTKRGSFERLSIEHTIFVFVPRDTDENNFPNERSFLDYFRIVLLKIFLQFLHR